MVNKDNMRKVTQALRSEKYNKTHGNLRNDKGFCALGVACQESGLGHWLLDAYSPAYMFVEDDNPREMSKSGLTKGVIGWLGIDPRDWGIHVHDEDGKETAVFELNDSGPTGTFGPDRDFHQIAALIEKEYEL